MNPDRSATSAVARSAEHVGLSFYTLGQRQGLGIGGVKERGAARGGAEHEPWYVAGKDLPRNVLQVVQGHDHPALQSRALVFDDVSWVAGQAPPPGRYAAKSRYRQADAPCRLDHDGAAFSLDFDAPQWAVTPGQSAVLYDGEVCLGGGVIQSATPWAAAEAGSQGEPALPGSLDPREGRAGHSPCPGRSEAKAGQPVDQ